METARKIENFNWFLEQLKNFTMSQKQTHQSFLLLKTADKFRAVDRVKCFSAPFK